MPSHFTITEVTAPTQVNQYDTISITVKYVNDGTDSSSSFCNIIDSVAGNMGGGGYGSHSPNSVGCVGVSYPANVAGTRTITIKVGEGTVQNQIRVDDTRTLTIYVAPVSAPPPTPTPPNFKISSFNYPTSVDGGKTVNVSYTVTNSGGSGEEIVSLRDETNNVPVRIDTITLASGESRNFSASLTMPGNTDLVLKLFCSRTSDGVITDGRTVTISLGVPLPVQKYKFRFKVDDVDTHNPVSGAECWYGLGALPLSYKLYTGSDGTTDWVTVDANTTVNFQISKTGYKTYISSEQITSDNYEIVRHLTIQKYYVVIKAQDKETGKYIDNFYSKVDGNSFREGYLSYGEHTLEVTVPPTLGAYENFSTKFNVTEDTTFVAQLVPIKYSLKIKVLYGLDKAVKGAEVTVNGITKVTGDDGIADFGMLTGGPYDFKIVASGYKEATGTLILDKDLVYEYHIDAVRYNVTFIVNDSDGEPVYGALITGKNKDNFACGTDENGMVTTKLASDTYSLMVTAVSPTKTYETYKGTFTVTGDTTVKVTLKVTSAPPVPIPKLAWWQWALIGIGALGTVGGIAVATRGGGMKEIKEILLLKEALRKD